MRFVSRAEWGATKPRSVTRIPGPVEGSTLHWEGPGMGTFPHTQCAPYIRGIQRYHMQTRRWSDLAYNAVVCQHGYTFEGRWLGARSSAQGTNQGNNISYAICGLWGSGDPFTDAGKIAYAEVRAYFDANGAGSAVRPHSYWHSTECPGNACRDWIKAGMPLPNVPPPVSPTDPTPTDKAVGVSIINDDVWTYASDGGVFSEGLPFHGSMGGMTLNKPIIGGMSHGPGGYWLVGADGGVFAFGDAPFLGSTGQIALNSPIVAAVPTAGRDGYWMMAADGGVFAFGTAGFFGSVPPLPLNSPISCAAATRSGAGYWMVGRDGGVFAYGNAGFFGSLGGVRLNAPIVAIVPTALGEGYHLVGADGGIFSFGDAPYIAPYQPLFQQYAAGARRIVSAVRGGTVGLVLISNLGERYVLG